MTYERVAWRPFASYRSEESGTKAHICESGASKTLCGKSIHRNSEGDSWANSPFVTSTCKRCWNSAKKRGLTVAEYRTLPWAKVR